MQLRPIPKGHRTHTRQDVQHSTAAHVISYHIISRITPCGPPSVSKLVFLQEPTVVSRITNTYLPHAIITQHHMYANKSMSILSCDANAQAGMNQHISECNCRDTPECDNFEVTRLVTSYSTPTLRFREIKTRSVCWPYHP